MFRTAGQKAALAAYGMQKHAEDVRPPDMNRLGIGNNPMARAMDKAGKGGLQNVISPVTSAAAKPRSWTSVASKGVDVVGQGTKKASEEEDDEPDPVAHLKKTADMYFGPEGAPITAGGIFLGHGGSPEERAQEEVIARRMAEIAQQHRSMNAIREAIQAEYPDYYVTQAYKREAAPEERMLRKKLYQRELESWQDRSTSPRVFYNIGEVATPAQQEFYRDVMRGVHRAEFDDPRHAHLLKQVPLADNESGAVVLREEWSPKQ